MKKRHRRFISDIAKLILAFIAVLIAGTAAITAFDIKVGVAMLIERNHRNLYDSD